MQEEKKIVTLDLRKNDMSSVTLHMCSLVGEMKDSTAKKMKNC